MTAGEAKAKAVAMAATVLDAHLDGGMLTERLEELSEPDRTKVRIQLVAIIDKLFDAAER